MWMNSVKRLVKAAAGAAAAATAWAFPGAPSRHGIIFSYHRVVDLDFVDPRLDDWNVPPAVFEEQLHALREAGTIVPLPDLPRNLEEDGALSKPFISITFDDGYENFYTRVLPLLERYVIPATVFVVTGAIGIDGPMPFDAWSKEHVRDAAPEAWRPMTWEQVLRCAASPVVHVGAHSHLHRDGGQIGAREVWEEAHQSRRALCDRIGALFTPLYAYPYGSSRLGQVSPAYVEAVRESGFSLAVSTDLGVARADTNRWLLPRVEAHPLDRRRVMSAKARGVLWPYRFTDRLRQRRRQG